MELEEHSEQSPNQIDEILEQDYIQLTEEEKQRIYRPRAHSVIIKLVGRKINHLYLKQRLMTMRKVSEEINNIHRLGT